MTENTARDDGAAAGFGAASGLATCIRRALLLMCPEELDPRTGRHLDTVPSAFTHLALINAVVPMIRLDGSAGVGGEVTRRPGP